MISLNKNYNASNQKEVHKIITKIIVQKAKEIAGNKKINIKIKGENNE